MASLFSMIYLLYSVASLLMAETQFGIICDVFFSYHFIILYSLHDQFENDPLTKVKTISPQETFKCQILSPSSPCDEKEETKLNMPTAIEIPTCTDDVKTCAVNV